MPMDWEAIFRDEQTYPDSTPIPFGNGQTVTLKELRDLNRKQQKQVAEELAATQRQREMMQAREKVVAEMADKATAIHNELQQQYAAAQQQNQQAQRTREVQANGGFDPENEYMHGIWYGPIRTRLEKVIEDIAKERAEAAQKDNIIRGMVNTFMADRWEREYEATADTRKRSKQIADWDQDRIRKYMEEQKIVDRYGLPSIREAVNKLTADERLQAHQEDAYERGLKEGEMRARMGVQPRPASAAAAMANAQPTPSTIDEALSPESLQNDHELMEMLSNLSRTGAAVTTGGTPNGR